MADHQDGPAGGGVAPFLAPGGFTRATEPPTPLRATLVDAFAHVNGRGWILVRQLSSVVAGEFFQVEQWLHSDGDVFRVTTEAARDRDAVEAAIAEASNTIRARGQPREYYHP